VATVNQNNDPKKKKQDGKLPPTTTSLGLDSGSVTVRPTAPSAPLPAQAADIAMEARRAAGPGIPGGAPPGMGIVSTALDKNRNRLARQAPGMRKGMF
jgi:hypothetical protein